MEKIDLLRYLCCVVDNDLIFYHQEKGVLPRNLMLLDLETIISYIETFSNYKL